MDHQAIADKLYEAEKNRTQFPMFSADHPEMTVEDAYKIQLINIRRRIEAGEHVSGMKIGLTSAGMQKLLNVDVPDYGHLMHSMLIPEGQPVRSEELIQPKVEGEIAFCLKKTLKGPHVTLADVYAATDYVVPALEIVDSRLTDWKIKLFDTVADNGSSARFILGSGMTRVDKVDMRLTGMTLEKNGELINSGTTAEVLGNPALAVAWLANCLSSYDIALEAGSIVLSGALTAALPAVKGDSFTATFHGLGAVSARFE